MSKRRTSGKGAYGVIKARYIRNTSRKTGKPVTANVQRLVYYNVYGNRGNNPEMQPRGQIYDQDGGVQKYGEYKSWALGQAQNQPYTYRVIISPKGKILTDDDFIQSIRSAGKETGVGSDFRVVIHRDTEHTHAHLLFQTNKTLKKKELENWKVQLRISMIEHEEIRAKALGIKPPKVGDDDTHAPPKSAVKNRNRGGKSVTDNDSPVAKQPSRRRRRRRTQSRERGAGLG